MDSDKGFAFSLREVVDLHPVRVEGSGLRFISRHDCRGQPMKPDRNDHACHGPRYAHGTASPSLYGCGRAAGDRCRAQDEAQLLVGSLRRRLDRAFVSCR